MGDDLSQLDAVIDAEFREVGWSASGLRTGAADTASRAAANGSELRKLTEAVQCLVEQFGVSSPRTLEGIENRLDIVAAVLNRQGPLGSPPLPNETRSPTHDDVAGLRSKLESLTTVFLEFGTSIRRAMSTSAIDITTALTEVERRLDNIEAVLKTGGTDRFTSNARPAGVPVSPPQQSTAALAPPARAGVASPWSRRVFGS